MIPYVINQSSYSCRSSCSYTCVHIAHRPPQGVQNIDWIPKTDPEPTGPFDIVQPVLQSPADSGDDWSIKSWLVTLDVRACVYFVSLTRTSWMLCLYRLEY